MSEPVPFDCVLVTSFGGPEQPSDVRPFLSNVTKGRNIPEERLVLVEQQYQALGGKSPLNDHNRAFTKALEQQLADDGVALPVFLGNRNWHPFLSDTVAELGAQGFRRAVAFVTSAYSSYSGCRQYREDLSQAIGSDTSFSIQVTRKCFTEAGFLDPIVDNVRAAFGALDPAVASCAFLVGTAHSIPMSMADTSDYEQQLQAVLKYVARQAGVKDRVSLAFQSRSGSPSTPWLEPDIGDVVESLAAKGVPHVVVAPIGFLSDHVEVLWDLDHLAAGRAAAAGIGITRVSTPGLDPRMVASVSQLVREVIGQVPSVESGRLDLPSRWCGDKCCPAPTGHGAPT